MTIVRIQIRRALSTEWQSINPVLYQGEFGLEIDTRKIKIGDDVTAWNNLEYIIGDELEAGTFAALQDVDTSTVENGSVVVYNSITGKYTAGSLDTRLTLTDGGNF